MDPEEVDREGPPFSSYTQAWMYALGRCCITVPDTPTSSLTPKPTKDITLKAPWCCLNRLLQGERDQGLHKADPGGAGVSAPQQDHAPRHQGRKHSGRQHRPRQGR